jgi:exodeoxyribonuclease VII small subunit
MKPENLSFEIAFEQLQSILEKMNSGALTLQQSLEYYERGEKLMRHCEALLKSAEQKIEEISKGSQGEILLNSDLTPRTVPFSGSND